MAGPSIVVRIMGDSSGFQKSVSDVGSAAQKIGSAIGQTLRGAFDLAATAAAVAGGALVAFGVDSFKTAARVGEMDATLRALSKGNAEVYAQMTSSVEAIRKQGIEYGVAQNLVAQFSRNNLDLARSTDLARVAQDAAVISGQNSSETLDQLIHGITTQNSLVLRNAGVNVQAGKAMDEYAAATGRSAKDLTEAERAQAVLNAVVAAGGPIAGAYAAAMEEPGKVLRSFPRLFNDIKVSVGEGLVGAFGPAILKIYELVKAFSESIKEGGNLRPVIDALVEKIAPLGARIADMAAKALDFIKNFPPGLIEKITGAISGLGGSAAAAGGAIGIMGIKNIPILGDLLGGINPLVAGLAGLVLSTEGGKSAMGALAKAIGPLLPVVTQIVGAVGRLAGEAFSRLVATVTPFLPQIGQLVAAFVDLAVRALIPLLPPFMKLVDNALPPLLALVGALLPVFSGLITVLEPFAPIIVGLAAVWLILNAVMAANPVVLITILILALIAGISLLVKWLIDAVNWGNVWGAAWGAVSGAVTAAFGFIRDIAMAVFGWIRDNWPLLLAIITGPIGMAVLLVVKNFDTIWAGIQAVFGWFAALPGRIVSALASLAGSLASIGRGALDAFVGAITAAAGAVFSFFGGLPGRILSALGSLGSLLWDAGKQILQGLLDGAKSMLGAVGDFFSGIKDKIFGWKGPLEVDRRLLGPAGVAIMEGLISGVESQLPALEATMRGVTDTVALGHVPGPTVDLGATAAYLAPGAGRLGPAVVIENVNLADGADVDLLMHRLTFEAMGAL